MNIEKLNRLASEKVKEEMEHITIMCYTTSCL